MQQEPIIEFRHLERTPALMNHIALNLKRLEILCALVISCHIVVDLEQNSHNKNKVFCVTITLTVPGKNMVSKHHGEENLYVIIQDAFGIIENQLKSWLQQSEHPHSRKHIFHGKVVRLIDDFGFIEDPSGEEFYFNQHGVLHGDYNKLNIGDTVEFHEFLGDKGPQALDVKRSNYYMNETNIK